jgi:hypothetical protein
MTDSRWVKRDRSYRAGFRWTPYAYRTVCKLTFLIFEWIVLNIIVTAFRAGRHRGQGRGRRMGRRAGRQPGDPQRPQCPSEVGTTAGPDHWGERTPWPVSRASPASPRTALRHL